VDSGVPVFNGQVALELSITPGVTVGTLVYSCAGPSVIPAGTVTIAQPTDSIVFVIGGIPQGAGYSCTLTGMDLEGGPCGGATGVFSVAGETTTHVKTDVICTVPYTGPDMDAAANDCPGIVSFNIQPSVVRAGGTAQISLVESTPTQGLAIDGGHTASNVTWSAKCATPPCGSFASDAGPADDGTATSFVCGPTQQSVTLTAQVREYRSMSDGDGGTFIGVCSSPALTTVSQTVLCAGSCGCHP
jgi:hypothetical protein